MTVEAALCLPLWLFFAAALMEPVRWLDRQRQVQTALECFSEELSQAVYLKELEPGSGEGTGNGSGSAGGAVDGEGGLSSGYVELLSGAAAGLWIQGKAEKLVDHVTVKDAKAPDPSGNICLEVEYTERIPFFPVYRQGITMKVASRRRGWIGLEGKLTESGEHKAEVGGADGHAVYVGAGMGRYHLYRDCHYISNAYEAVSLNQAAKMTNQFGERYRPCSRCADSGHGDRTVYVTAGGGHYHFNRACSAMVSYVRTVDLEDVGHLGVCSYCASRKKAEGGG
ncbi:MAG: hypothetical protein KHZ10_08035 [Clostridium sp.]|nr:hypothetical protein [Clostridium sp.]